MTRYKATTYHQADLSTGPVLCVKASSLNDLAHKLRVQGLILVQAWYWNQGQWWSIPNETVRQEVFP